MKFYEIEFQGLVKGGRTATEKAVRLVRATCTVDAIANLFEDYEYLVITRITEVVPT